jgi:hypothetical protein
MHIRQRPQHPNRQPGLSAPHSFWTKYRGQVILTPAPEFSNAQAYQEIRESETGEVPTVVPSPPGAATGPDFPPDLAHVVAIWEGLPDAIKRAIITLTLAVQDAEE